MSTESLIGISSGVIAIIGAAFAAYKYVRSLSVANLFEKLTDKSLSPKKHRRILSLISQLIHASGDGIKREYINSFVLNDRNKEALFLDICLSNDIYPSSEVCHRFLRYDAKNVRKKYNDAKGMRDDLVATKIGKGDADSRSSADQIVFVSELLKSKYPSIFERLTGILDKYNVKYSLIKGTKDIWCRDYMPVQTPSGKLIQFRYEPSYLAEKEEYAELRSDVKEICRLNDLSPVFSDINLDGGNVLICDGRAIISDRIFTENPDADKDSLVKELSRLLECEVIIIPAQKGDMTGHADGMVRFVNRDTVVGNSLKIETKVWAEPMREIIVDNYMKYVNMPFVPYVKDRKHPLSAVGIYVNYLELNDLIIFPVFGIETDKDALEVISREFPNKVIEPIDYTEVAYEGGLINCSTWVLNR